MQHSLQHTNGICLGGGQPLVGPGLACGGTRELAQEGHSGTAYVLCLQTFEFRQRLGHAPQFPQRYSTMITQPGLFRDKLQSGIEMVQACTGIDGCRSSAKMCLDHDVPSCGAGARIVGRGQSASCQCQGSLRLTAAEGSGSLLHTLRWAMPLLLRALPCPYRVLPVLFGHESSPSWLLKHRVIIDTPSAHPLIL